MRTPQFVRVTRQKDIAHHFGRTEWKRESIRFGLS